MTEQFIEIFYNVLELLAPLIVPVFGLWLMFYFIGHLLLGDRR